MDRLNHLEEQQQRMVVADGAVPSADQQQPQQQQPQQQQQQQAATDRYEARILSLQNLVDYHAANAARFRELYEQLRDSRERELQLARIAAVQERDNGCWPMRRPTGTPLNPRRRNDGWPWCERRKPPRRRAVAATTMTIEIGILCE